MLFPSLPNMDHPDVKLRPITEEDIPAWYAMLLRFEVIEHTSWNVPSEDALMPVIWGHGEPTDSSPAHFTIARKDNDQLVGRAGFHNVSGPHRSAELGYELMPAVWGRGIASAVSRALLDWAHQQASIIRVQAVVMTSNTKSIRVLERCGFEKEGLLRSYKIVRGVPQDFWMYSHIELSVRHISPHDSPQYCGFYLPGSLAVSA